MKRRTLLKQIVATAPMLALPPLARAADDAPFTADWDSLTRYRTPDWFRDAKFGIWAHWGPQCEPEHGDWYARAMYEEGSDAYKHHVATYGHPSVFGFKDVIQRWKAEQWDPESLVALYKRAGARYFVALANHHDNFDNFASTHQPQWNSTKVGPMKDLIGGWSKAARNNGLRFGVSVHAAHAWTWYEPAQRADRQGPMAGVPYDGNLTVADGKGKWWEGFDPQGLYAQRHALSESRGTGSIHKQWDWGAGASVPDQAYCEKFYRRTAELLDNYDPDLIYYDDTALPLWPVSDVGLRLAAHMYNRSIERRGSLDVVVNGKVLDERQRKAMVWDIERGASERIEPLPWQTCTCIGSWHYDRRIYERKGYKSAQTVVHMLIDIVSKNGNLLLSVPVRGNGTIDEQERAIVEEIGRWMAVNGVGIYDTRPWAVFGEGPAMAAAAPILAQGFNEGKGKPLTAEDIRFTTKDGAVYAFVMGWPASGKVSITSLRKGSPHHAGSVARVELVGGGALGFKHTAEALEVVLPAAKPALPYAFALKIV